MQEPHCKSIQHTSTPPRIHLVLRTSGDGVAPNARGVARYWFASPLESDKSSPLPFYQYCSCVHGTKEKQHVYRPLFSRCQYERNNGPHWARGNPVLSINRNNREIHSFYAVPYTVRRTPYTVRRTPYAIRRTPYSVPRRRCTCSHEIPSYNIHTCPSQMSWLL